MIVRGTQRVTPRGDELQKLVRSSPPLRRVLAVVRESGLPEAWIGGGVIRDLVWGHRYGRAAGVVIADG
ncbi:hypothetical protein Vwe01_63990 [Micromonospora andamanensis]|nr:hypothetical protein Vwe01_63990 [Micromonospora andamanensis]